MVEACMGSPIHLVFWVGVLSDSSKVRWHLDREIDDRIACIYLCIYLGGRPSVHFAPDVFA